MLLIMTRLEHAGEREEPTLYQRLG